MRSALERRSSERSLWIRGRKQSRRRMKEKGQGKVRGRETGRERSSTSLRLGPYSKGTKGSPLRWQTRKRSN